MCYKAKHNYIDTPLCGLEDFLKELYNTSIEQYNKTKDTNINTKKDEENKQIIYELVENIEDYILGLVVLNYIDNDNYNEILNRFYQLKSVRLIKENKNDISRINRNSIEINPNIASVCKLESSTSIKFVMSYELTRFIQGGHFKDTERYISSLPRNINVWDLYFGLEEKDKYHIQKGYIFLDNILARAIAKDVSNFFIKQQKKSTDINMYDPLVNTNTFQNIRWFTSFDDILNKFIDKINYETTSTDDLDKIDLFDFSKLSLREKFISNLAVRFRKYRQEEELLHIIMLIGALSNFQEEYSYTNITPNTIADYDYDLYDLLKKKKKKKEKNKNRIKLKDIFN